MRLTDEDIKYLNQCFKYRILKEKYTSYWTYGTDHCTCGGIFEFVEEHFPYSEIHVQCNKCDGTKIL